MAPTWKCNVQRNAQLSMRNGYLNTQIPCPLGLCHSDIKKAIVSGNAHPLGAFFFLNSIHLIKFFGLHFNTTNVTNIVRPFSTNIPLDLAIWAGSNFILDFVYHTCSVVLSVLVLLFLAEPQGACVWITSLVGTTLSGTNIPHIPTERNGSF